MTIKQAIERYEYLAKKYARKSVSKKSYKEQAFDAKTAVEYSQIADWLKEVRPHGRWIEREDEGEFYWECSECGQRINWVDETDHYCCNCGTKMGAEA